MEVYNEVKRIHTGSYKDCFNLLSNLENSILFSSTKQKPIGLTINYDSLAEYFLYLEECTWVLQRNFEVIK